MAKKELAVINLDQFSIQQLPELQNKKEEVAEKLSTFKYVEVTDNTSYEEAKKIRTGVRTLRTDLQKEQKAVDKKIKDFVLGPVKDAYEGIISAVIDVENIQQEEVTRWEDIKEQERLEKQRIEQERINKIKNHIEEFERKAYEIIDSSTIENVNENKSVLDEMVNAEFDFQEFLVAFEQARVRVQYRFDVKCGEIQEKENQRLENERLAKEKAEADEKLRKIQEQQEKERQEAEAKFQAIELQREKERAEREAKEEQLKEKQLEVRKNRLLEIGLNYSFEHDTLFVDEKSDFILLMQDVSDADIIEFENIFNESKKAIQNFKEQIKSSKEVEEVVEQAPIIYPAFGDQSETILENIATESEPLVSDSQTITGNHLVHVNFEESWSDILQEYYSQSSDTSFNETEQFIDWLEQNYNVPTKK